jgi:ABC-type amino acid transport substrate-binding protein
VLASKAQVESALAAAKPANIALRSMPLPGFASPGWDIGMAVKENSRNLGDAIEGLLDGMVKSGELKAIFARYGVTWTPALAA